MTMQSRVKTQDQDVAESIIHGIDEGTTKATGTSIFHILTLVSMGASIALFLGGKHTTAIFVGLWPPTFQALKSAAENK